MQNEHAHLTHLIGQLQTRLAQIPATDRPASNKLLRSYDIRNHTVSLIKRSLVEIMGKDDAYEIIADAEKQAEIWYAELKR